MKTLLALLLLTTATHAEVVCPDLYCWLPLVPGTGHSCTVSYELATGQCRSACNGAPISNRAAGDTYTKTCPGIPGLLNYCVAYMEQEPTPFTAADSPGFLFTTSEGEGGCAYWAP